LKDPRLKDSVSGEKGLGSINSLPNFLSCIVLYCGSPRSVPHRQILSPRTPGRAPPA
jgi:hypothetical protein